MAVADRGGQLSANSNSAWADTEVTRTASYDPSDSYKLTNVTNASRVLPGSLVQGNGVGREVYVRSVNASNGELTLSLPLYAAPSNQIYTFTRYKYLLDFSGFEWLSRFMPVMLENIDFACNGDSVV